MCSAGSQAESEGETRLILHRRAIDPDQLPRHLKLRLQSRMDTLGQCRKIGIIRTDHNTRMLRCGLMQSNEMPSIEREHDALFCHGKRQDIHIRDCLPGPATLRSRQDVMTEAPQDLHDGQGKIFVGIAPRHPSCRFVRKNIVLNLLLVRTGIGPCIG